MNALWFIPLKVRKCVSLNVIDPQNLIGRGTIRRRGFVGMDIALMKEVLPCAAVVPAFEVF